MSGAARKIIASLEEALAIARGERQAAKLHHFVRNDKDWRKVLSEGMHMQRVFFSAEDEGFIAIDEDYPGCSAFGETTEEAEREFEDAREAWLMAAIGAGN